MERLYIEIIDKEYKTLIDGNHRLNFNVLFNIIAFKKDHKDYAGFKQPLYLDVKQFLYSYIDAVGGADFGYDFLSEPKIQEAISGLSANEQVAIYRYLCHLYVQRGYDTEPVREMASSAKLQLALKERAYLRYLLLLSSRNIMSLILSYLLFVLVVFVMLLPAPIEQVHFLDTDMAVMCDSFWLNHMMNILALFCGIDDFGPRIIPVGIVGMLLYLAGIIVYFLLIANFIVRKIGDLINVGL